MKRYWPIHYNWKLLDKNTQELYADHCTCADHCKEKARKIRRKDAVNYNQEIEFVIQDPYGIDFQYSLANTGWRMKWVWIKHKEKRR